MKMKILIVTLLFSTALLFGAEILSYFQATSDGRSITLTWRSTDESSVKYYDIERSTSGLPFKSVTIVMAKGFGTNYSYVDETALMRDNEGTNTTLSASTYKYRIRIVGKDNSTAYSNTAYVAHNVSSIRRTWGMIKEMFR